MNRMYNLRSKARKTNLLYALELLDGAVRKSLMKTSYVGSTVELAVSEAMRRAKKKPRTAAIEPREDQLPLLA